MDRSQLKMFLLAGVLFFGCVEYSEGLQCHMQRCLNCSPSNLTLTGNVTECTAANVVHVGWLQDVHISYPEDSVNVAQDYACLKYFALPEDGIATSRPDLIRGCVAKGQSDRICIELKNEERARERKSECTICADPLCNAASQTGPAFLLLAIGAFYKLFLSVR